MIDPFGLHQESETEEYSHPIETSTPNTAASSRKRLWAVLLVLDTVFLFVFGGTLAGMVYMNGNPVKLWDRFFQAATAQLAIAKSYRTGPKNEPPPAATAAPQPTEPAADKKPASPAAVPVHDSLSAQERKATAVDFTCSATSAAEVFLKGAFLVRNKNGMKQMKYEDGTYRLSVALFPGSYKYQCIIDGKKSAFKTVEVP